MTLLPPLLHPILHSLLADPMAGVLLVDHAGMILQGNAVLAGMLGGPALLAAGADMVGIFAAAEHAPTGAAVRAVLADGKPRNWVTRLQTASADPHHGVTVSALKLPPDGPPDGPPNGSGAALLLRITDMTAQLRLEAQLAHSQKLQAIGQLAGGIAHDFNNLLTAILGAAEMVRARSGVDAATHGNITQITSAAERGAALVRQLLAFGRQQTLQPRVIAINAAMRDIADLLRPLLGARIKLELDLDQAEPLARVDPTQLDQVLVNLAVNARDAMAQGGTLTLHSGHASLYRALTRGAETIPPGDYVMVEVRDTGTGIPPEIMPRIFDPFFTTKRDQGGTGLGLATVHGIIRQSEGFLTVESQPANGEGRMQGGGTSLRIYLPRHAGPPDPLPAPVGPPAPVGTPLPPATGRIVLLVDDEAMVRDLMTSALRQQGWQVLACESAEAALAMLATRGPAPLTAVISDVAMPGMDGPALIRHVRARQPGLPAILISGYAAEALRGDLTSGNIAFLPKPYTLKDLVALLAHITQGPA